MPELDIRLERGKREREKRNLGKGIVAGGHEGLGRDGGVGWVIKERVLWGHFRAFKFKGIEFVHY